MNSWYVGEQLELDFSNDEVLYDTLDMKTQATKATTQTKEPPKDVCKYHKFTQVCEVPEDTYHGAYCEEAAAEMKAEAIKAYQRSVREGPSCNLGHTLTFKWIANYGGFVCHTCQAAANAGPKK
jgi:hypothetical protein